MPATLHDNPELSRFEMDDDGVLAVANYRLADNLSHSHTRKCRRRRVATASLPG
jgi:hypothetical protein